MLHAQALDPFPGEVALDPIWERLQNWVVGLHPIAPNQPTA